MGLILFLLLPLLLIIIIISSSVMGGCMFKLKWCVKLLCNALNISAAVSGASLIINHIITTS